MEKLSFSHKPDEKVFFLGALAGLGKTARTFRRIRPSRTPRPSVSRQNIPVKISIGDINTGNNQQKN